MLVPSGYFRQKKLLIFNFRGNQIFWIENGTWNNQSIFQYFGGSVFGYFFVTVCTVIYALMCKMGAYETEKPSYDSMRSVDGRPNPATSVTDALKPLCISINFPTRC